MSDYLSNLAAKSLEAVPTIRPRLASFYEAPQRVFALPPEPPAETGEEHSESVAAATPAQSREMRTAVPPKRLAVTVDLPDVAAVADDVQPRIAPIAAAAVGNETTAASAPPAPQRMVDRAAASTAVTPPPAAPIGDDVVSAAPQERRGRREVPAIATAEGAIELTPESVTHIVMTLPERTPTRLAPPETRHETAALEMAIDTAAAPQTQTAQPEPSALSARHKEPARTTLRDRQPVVAPANEHSSVTTHEPSLPDRVPPSMTAMPSIPARHRITPSRIVADSQPPLRVRPLPRHPHADRQPPPDVHITIGRVEVRAVAAEPPPRVRSAAPSGLMNLDDYLRRRDGRGRR